jgi:hypothetical protein
VNNFTRLKTVLKRSILIEFKEIDIKEKSAFI